MEQVLVVGSLNMDMTVTLSHFPAVGETILAGGFQQSPGGKGANQAYAIGKLGGAVRFLGAVGDDPDGQALCDNLRQAGVKVEGVLVKPGGQTGRAIIYVDSRGDNSIVVLPGANALLTAEDIRSQRQLLEECSTVLLQMEIPMGTIDYTIRTAFSLGKRVILDPAPATGEFPKELYPYIDIIKPNETELGILLGDPDAGKQVERSARRLKEYGVKNVLVTLGEKGVYVDTQNGETAHIPGHAVRAVDTTAAGDSFSAALAMKLSMGEKLIEAVRYANLVSSIVVTRKGAQSSVPSGEEVEEQRKKIYG
ncbi:MAG: ribokinase [Provencibacterium sp.]|jgi:ribokinase|nr:ribokinase [Provencibacterium sp.]